MLAIDAIEGIPVLPEHDAVIIDEGHELVDRATAADHQRAHGRHGREGDRAGAPAGRSGDPGATCSDAADALDDAMRLGRGGLTGPTRQEELGRDLRAGA